jgi:hypothetical protein
MMAFHSQRQLCNGTVHWHTTNTSTGNLAQGRQAELQYFGAKAAKQAPVFGTKRQTKNQYLAQSCMHTNTFTGTLLANVSTVNQ